MVAKLLCIGWNCLADTLQDMLEAAGKFAQMEQQAKLNQEIQDTLRGVPLLIYVG